MSDRRNIIMGSALQFASEGCPVFPLVYGTKNLWQPPNKPEDFHQKTQDPEIIRGWFDQGAMKNVAAVTGWESGMVLIDIDFYRGGQQTIEGLLKSSGLTSTLAAQSASGGYHFYYQLPTDRIYDNIWGLQEGMSVISLGYAILPGSLHENGVVHRWVNTDSFHRDKMSPCPAWILEALTPNSKPRFS